MTANSVPTSGRTSSRVATVCRWLSLALLAAVVLAFYLPMPGWVLLVLPALLLALSVYLAVNAYTNSRSPLEHSAA